MIYGIDGEHVEISQGYGSFVFSWGLAVGAETEDDFREAYSETISQLKEKYRLESERKVYCSYELKKELADEEAAYEFIEDFKSSLHEEIDTVTVIFSFFPEKEEVKSYTDQKPSKLDVKDFHKKHLGDYYEHICAWQIFSKQTNIERIIVDGFQGHRTRAWEELKDNISDLKMIHKGDQVSELISTADLLLEKMEKDFEKQNRWIGKDEIRDYFDEHDFNIKAEYLGTSLLAVLTPTQNRHIPTHKIVREPVYMVMRPDTSKIGKKELIDSPQGIRLQNEVCQEKGSLKFYNSREDKDKLEFDSTIVHVGEEGEKEARTLVESYGYDVDLTKFREI